MTVTRPISFDTSGGGFPQLSEEERRQLQEENGPRRFGLRNLGKPGTKFSRDDFVAATQNSASRRRRSRRSPAWPASRARRAGSRSSAIHVEGTVPQEPSSRSRRRLRRPGSRPAGRRPAQRRHRRDHRERRRPDEPRARAITPGQISSGRYFTDSDTREAVLDTATRRGRASPSARRSSSAEVVHRDRPGEAAARRPVVGRLRHAHQLQALSDRKGRVNTVYVRAKSAEQVGALARHIRDSVDGASVTTARTSPIA